ncbi:MAG: LptF/LptG family permease [Armatimonadota bacterium]|nr:LptF/LptG family permease [bacterium]
MKTLDKYVAKEMMVPFIAGFAVVLILLIGNIIYNSIDLIVSRIQQWPDLLYYIILQTPYWVMLALPAGALFGCTLAVSRLARDSEITMMRMAGISVRRIFLPVFIVGALTSIVAFVFQERVTVWTQRESVKVLKRIYLAPGAIPIQAKVFFRAEQYYFYVDRIERSHGKVTLTDLMIYEPPIGRGFPTLITAKSSIEEDHVWYLRDCTIYRVNQNGDPELIGHPRKMKLDLRRAVTDYFTQEQKVPEAMSIAELKNEMNKLKESGHKSDSYQLEYGYKLAIPLSSLVLLFCVAPLSLRFGRGGGFMGVLIGIVVLFFYWNVILFSRVLGKTGGLPPGLAGWSEVIIFTALGIYLMWKVE